MGILFPVRTRIVRYLFKVFRYLSILVMRRNLFQVSSCHGPRSSIHYVGFLGRVSVLRWGLVVRRVVRCPGELSTLRLVVLGGPEGGVFFLLRDEVRRFGASCPVN